MDHARRGHSGKSWIGVLIIAAGVVWLASVLGAPVPEWLFTWPVALIAFGLVSGIGSGFRNLASFVLILIGLVFLAHYSFWPELNMEKYLWPVVLIFICIAFLVKRHRWDRKKQWLNEYHPEWRDWHTHLREHWQRGCAARQAMASPPAAPEPPAPEPGPPPAREGRKVHSGEDWIDITTVFGGTRRQIFSKDFKGGDLVNVCGGTEIDFTHADIQGTVFIDVVVLWGGVRIAVPPNWQVRLDVTHIMGGTDVQRGDESAVQDPGKVLVFTGTVMMAGIEIRDVL
jgi:predicted membrane protein